MELVYRSFDGKIFDFEEECLEHEAKVTDFKMFSSQGEPTTYYEDALLIYISNYTEAVAEVLEKNEVYFEGCPDKDEWWAFSDFHNAFVDVTVALKIFSDKTARERKEEMGV
jgi:hypothetical protein